MNHTIDVLALDLEGTLISTIITKVPRPGLFEFLDKCHDLFERIVIFTLVEEEDFRDIARELVEIGYAPTWFQDIEYIEWDGGVKDLHYISGINSIKNTIIVDDNELLIHPNQKNQWIKINDFDDPFPSGDAELKRVIFKLISCSKPQY